MPRLANPIDFASDLSDAPPAPGPSEGVLLPEVGFEKYAIPYSAYPTRALKLPKPVRSKSDGIPRLDAFRIPSYEEQARFRWFDAVAVTLIPKTGMLLHGWRRFYRPFVPQIRSGAVASTGYTEIGGEQFYCGERWVALSHTDELRQDLKLPKRFRGTITFIVMETRSALPPELVRPLR